MGSGLILLVIVAAWLAVLVPMALRSHDSADSLSSVDRFSDAMRVLARRDAAARARASEVAGAVRLGADDDWDDEEWDDAGWDADGTGVWARARTAPARAAARLRRGDRRPATPAARRRRLLAGLLLLATGTLLAGLLLTPVLLAAHAVSLVLLGGYVVALRRLAVSRQAARRASSAARADRPARPRRAAEPAPSPVLQAAEERGEPVQEPAEEPLEEPAVAAVRHDEPLPAAVGHVTVGLGAPWSPVPVPPPIYASAPVAPRLPRTADPVRGAGWSQQTAGERLPGMEDGLPGGAEPAPRRRAVNDW